MYGESSRSSTGPVWSLPPHAGAIKARHQGLRLNSSRRPKNEKLDLFWSVGPLRVFCPPALIRNDQ